MQIIYASVNPVGEALPVVDCQSTREWESSQDIHRAGFFLSLFGNSKYIEEDVKYIGSVINGERSITDDIVHDFWTVYIYNPICDVKELIQRKEEHYCKIHVDDLKSMLSLLGSLWKECEQTKKRVEYKTWL